MAMGHGGVFKSKQAIKFARTVEKHPKRYSGSPDWIEHLMSQMRSRGNPSRIEAEVELTCPALPNEELDLSGRFIVHAWRGTSVARPQRCSARLAYIDEDGRHWNVVRCNGSAGHGRHTNRAVDRGLFPAGVPVTPHTHYLTMATLEAIEDGEDTDPENHAVAGGSWDTARGAIRALARRGNILEYPYVIFDPRMQRRERELP